MNIHNMQFKSKIVKLCSSVALILVFFIIAGLWADWNKQQSLNRDDTKLNELRSLSFSIPTYPDFREVAVESSSRDINAGIYKSYRSSANYSEVKKFYSDILLSKGWVIYEEKNLNSWIMNTGGWKELTFRKNDLLISVEYKGSIANQQWNYSVSFVWFPKK